MQSPPRLFLLATLAALTLLAPATADARSGGSVQPKIVGGTTASVSTYPWQTALVTPATKMSGDAHDRQFCGGSLLTSRIVITAAHCVWGGDPDCPILCDQNHLEQDDVDVVLGYSTLSSAPESAEAHIQAVRIQSNYDDDYRADGVPRFDAAYLVLSSASGQTPIKIAGDGEGSLWDPGSVADISGWGSTREKGGTVDTLRSATVGVIDDSTCGSPSVYGGDFDAATMVCAGYMSGGVDTCYGDSGGPLEAPLEGGGYRLVGITGWGDGCARAGAPGVYTRVAGSTMSSLIAADVAGLDSQYGLPAEPIFGVGAQQGAAAGANRTGVAKALKKCRRIHNRKKRRRCAKRAKKRAASTI